MLPAVANYARWRSLIMRFALIGRPAGAKYLRRETISEAKPSQLATAGSIISERSEPISEALAEPISDRREQLEN